ncbi:MAG TPA: flagellar biosynthesis protein FlhF [Spirochaetota bacterium]|nr:flagellar biosynthesis protein FlhF [Spirochaetota bacterium]HPJ38208.1 flagellar biosynthesis protein FlhF [Spirochaetota bacterium]HPQ52367.1 flagellar biosynthesis protein FlhF [Spirochaetota bacterium]
MKYVKIKAKTYNEAMMKLKMDYGDEAIPISHKYVKEGGVLNTKIFARDVVELTAAIQEKKPFTRPPEKKSTVDFTVGDNDAARKILTSKILSSINRDIHREDDDGDIVAAPVRSAKPVHEEPRETVFSQEKPNEEKTPGTVTLAKDELDSLKKFEKEFHEIKQTLSRLMDNQRCEPERVAAVASEEDKILEPYKAILTNNDYNQDECIKILDEVKNSISRDDLKDRFKIEKTLKDLMRSRIVTTGPFNVGQKKKIIMFFGPTGVGKTTTMAKLGAIYALREEQRVAFVTIDNYRIAATEQLKKYAEIMKIPVHVVNDQKDFKELIEREKSEIIMIDTSGRSHRNELKISEIKSYADMVEYDFEKILCVSANTKKGDIRDVFKAFDKINFNSIIITKVDETSYIGNIIDVADKYNKPISYFTNGQEVPNDIVLAESDMLVNMMIGSVNNL